MARLWSNGFELQSTTSGMEWDTTTGSPTISTSIKNVGGSASLRCNPTASTAFIYHTFRVDAQTKTYIRFYLYIASLPASDTTIMKLEDSTPASVMSLKLSSTGALKVWKDPTNAQLGSSSSALSIGQWYRIEFSYNDADANNLVSARVDGTDFVTEATGDDIAGWGRVGIGIVSSATADIYIDDIAINDTSGSYQNSWAGAGSIKHLHPNANGDNSDGTITGASTRWEALDEVTPNDATDYVTLTNTANIIDVGVESLGGADSIAVVAIGHRANATSATACSVALRIKSASGGTTTSSGQIVRNTTAWSTHDDTVDLHQHKLTTYVDPTTGVAWTATGTNSIENMQIGISSTDVTPNPNVTALWAMVDYVPSTGTDYDITKTADYAVTPTPTITKTAQYTVIGTVDVTKSAQYTVSTTTTVTETAQYTVPITTTVTKSAQYVVDKVVTVTKSAQYVVTALGAKDIPAQYTVYSYPTYSVASGYEVKPTPLQKTYSYKVYSKTGTYLSTWQDDVMSEFELSEELNTGGSEMVIELARKADDYGEGYDVYYGNKVMVYCIDKEAPNGVLVFQGTISKYRTNYKTETVLITLLGYGAELSQRMILDGSNTTVAYNSYDPSNILKGILDAYGGNITYDGSSIDLTGTTVSYTFQTNTVKEGIDKVLELAPADWYYYIDQATNLLHFHQKTNTASHVFAIGRDLAELGIEKNLERVVNTVFFSGGDTGGGVILYKKYTNSTSITNYGVRAVRYKDGRVTLTATADIIGQRLLQGSPEILVDVAVIDSNNNPDGYDLEIVKIGQTVKIGSSGIGASSQYDVAVYDTGLFDYDLGDLSSIVFQITKKVYNGSKITMSLSTTPPDITKRIQDINRNLEAMQNNDNPTAPS